MVQSGGLRVSENRGGEGGRKGKRRLRRWSQRRKQVDDEGGNGRIICMGGVLSL